ncbi:MAG: hypothetical protein KC550_02750 [Nanoarchaeota archaeon]|nr:hypothetical protein [Nanoarchaeota archaeon]
MSREQIALWINNKHQPLLTKFKQEITELEGGYYGFLGDYVAEALEFYLHYMKHFPEKIGKEKHTISNLTKTQQRMNKFIEFGGISLNPISGEGLDYLTFQRLLQSCFNKSEKTLRTYEKEILLCAGWSVINIPASSKRIVLHRQSNLYGFVQRFDLTLKHYHSGLKPNKNEEEIFSQVRFRLMPQDEDLKINTAKKEADLFFSEVEK